MPHHLLQFFLPRLERALGYLLEAATQGDSAALIQGQTASLIARARQQTQIWLELGGLQQTAIPEALLAHSHPDMPTEESADERTD